MSSVDLLKIIKDKLITNCLVEIKNCKVKLEENNIENGKKSKLSSIHLKGLNTNYLVLHMDNPTYISKGGICSPFICEKQECHKICDYIIIELIKDNGHNRLNIIFIEMKSDTVDCDSVNQKFKSSCAIFYYVKKIVEFELNNNQLLELNEKYILLTTNSHIAKIIKAHQAKTKGYTKKIIYEPKTVKNGDTISVNTI